jgi:hypothetical protein
MLNFVKNLKYLHRMAYVLAQRHLGAAKTKNDSKFFIFTWLFVRVTSFSRILHTFIGCCVCSCSHRGHNLRV